jgi:uncharacterized membrane protein YbhN (UPF0104 family)
MNRRSAGRHFPRTEGCRAPTGIYAAPRLWKLRDWAVGLAVLAALGLLVHFTVGWAPLLAPWATLPPSTLGIAFGLTALSYMLRGLRAYNYFGVLVRGNLLDMLRLSVLHNTANNLLPMRTGEAVFPWLMKSWFGYRFIAAGASLVWIRLIDLHVMGLAGLVVLWLRKPHWSVPVLALIWMLVPIGVAAVVVRGGARHLSNLPFLSRVVGLMSREAPTARRVVAQLYLWTVLSWSAKLSAFVAILGHFLRIERWQLLIGVIGAELASILPIHGVAGSGSYEFVTVGALLPFGVGAERAFAGAVNLHLFLLGTTVLLGMLAWFLPGRKVFRR